MSKWFFFVTIISYNVSLRMLSWFFMFCVIANFQSCLLDYFDVLQMSESLLSSTPSNFNTMRILIKYVAHLLLDDLCLGTFSEM